MMPTDAGILGTELQKARERRDLTIDQAAQQTKIRPKFLEALEQGNYAVLPGDVQTRGFLRIYARFLGLDEEAAIVHFDAARQASRSRRRRQPQQPTLPPLSNTPPAPPPPPSPVPPAVPVQSAARQTQTIRQTQQAQAVRPPAHIAPPRVPVAIPSQEELQQRERRTSFFTSLAVGTAGVLIIGGLLFLGWFGLQGLIAQSTPKPGSLILSPIPGNPAGGLGTATVTTTPLRPSPLPPPQTLAPTPAGNPAGRVTVSLQIIQRTWLKVVVDGQQLYLGTIPPNTVLQYQGNSIQVRAANAAGVRAIVNGQDLGLLGSRGQIYDQTFTPGGVTAPPAAPPPVQPTPTARTQGLPSPPTSKAMVSTSPTRLLPTATASILPTLPPTSTASNTPRPSFTPTVTATPTITATPSSTKTPTSTTTPSLTYTPSITFTPSMTLTPSNTPFILPRETSTPDTGQVRPK